MGVMDVTGARFDQRGLSVCGLCRKSYQEFPMMCRMCRTGHCIMVGVEKVIVLWEL